MLGLMMSGGVCVSVVGPITYPEGHHLCRGQCSVAARGNIMGSIGSMHTAVLKMDAMGSMGAMVPRAREHLWAVSPCGPCQ